MEKTGNGGRCEWRVNLFDGTVTLKARTESTEGRRHCPTLP